LSSQAMAGTPWCCRVALLYVLQGYYKANKAPLRCFVCTSAKGYCTPQREWVITSMCMRNRRWQRRRK
jgi:hypothetical protein